MYLGVWLSDLDRDVNWAMSSFLHSPSCKQMSQCLDSGERQCDVERSSLLVYIKLRFSGELRGFVEEIGGKKSFWRILEKQRDLKTLPTGPTHSVHC